MPTNLKSRGLAHRSTTEGFSLVEMLIYIFILVLMLSVIMNIIVSVTKSGRIIKAQRSTDNSSLVSFERITRETRQADSINQLLSVFDTNPGELVLEGTDELDQPRTVRFYLSNGVLMLAENGVNVGAITQADARVTSLIFRRFSSVSSEGIRTEITIESGTSTSYRSNNFYFSSTIR